MFLSVISVTCRLSRRTTLSVDVFSNGIKTTYSTRIDSIERETKIENKKKTKSLTFSATRVILLMRHLEDQHSMYAHTHAQKLDWSVGWPFTLSFSFVFIGRSTHYMSRLHQAEREEEEKKKTGRQNNASLLRKSKCDWMNLFMTITNTFSLLFFPTFLYSRENANIDDRLPH